MAKRAKKRGEKTQAIRDYRTSNPNAKPAQIAEELNKVGLSVTPQYVSTILSKDKKTGKGKRRGRPPGRKPAAARTASFDNLLAAKKLVEKAGSVEAAKSAIAQYSELMA
jgi:hypothetical protein